MSEARYVRSDDLFKLQAEATIDAYSVIQLPTGEAAFLDAAAPVSSGAYTDQLRTRGKATVVKATGFVALPGQDAWWDHSANNVTYKRVNDRDFRVGVFAEDAASAAISCVVDLNKARCDLIDVNRDPCLSTTAGTAAAGGFGRALRVGGSHKLLLSSTSEAQKVDLLSVDGVAPGAKWIAEAVIRVISDGAGTTPDFSIGLANGTHATDADSITESCFLHLDGNAADIFAESDDGTTEVAATDTTINYTEGSAVANRVHVLFDGRDLADIQVYVNGSLVLGSTVFKLDAATGPLFLLAHLEKTSSADVYEVDIDTLRLWTSEQ